MYTVVIIQRDFLEKYIKSTHEFFKVSIVKNTYVKIGEKNEEEV